MAKIILVPVDGSDHSFKALDIAVALGRNSEHDIELMHVVPTRKLPAGLRQWADTALVESTSDWLYAKTIGENVLESAKQRVQENAKMTVRTCVEHGDPAERIIEGSNRAGVDMVVMGTRGLTHMKGLALGSVAQKVNLGAKCTVISVK